MRGLAVAALLAAAGARAQTAPSPAVAAPAVAPAPTLRQAAARDDLLIGSSFVFVPGTYRDVALREFGVLTAENAMKWQILRPEASIYDFRAADALVRLARGAGQKVRGHTLVWHRQLPDWLVNGNFTRDEMIQILHDHIASVVGHFRNLYPGTVYQWDVVNEAVADCPGPERCGFRDSIWLQRIGPEYIEMAFRFAHEADPDATLYYNDYGYEAPDAAGRAKRDGVLHLVEWLKSRGAPVQGVGLQLHDTRAGPSQATLDDLMSRIAALGVDLAVTELDVGMVVPGQVKPPPPAVLSAADLQQQAQTYARTLDSCLRQARCHTFVMWGFSDAVTWRGPDQPCIFDRNYQPKPAYYALRDRLLRGRTP